MTLDKAGNTEYGTFLEYRNTHDQQINTVEFWGKDHSTSAEQFLIHEEIKKCSDMHRFGPLQRIVK